MKSNHVLRSKTLQVKFIWQHDRWHHEISGAGAEHVVWRSREGTGDDVWPPSPALQDLHVATGIAGESTALLVGSTSVAHWSVSIEVDDENDRLKFDVACRLKAAAVRLGNAYQREDSADLPSSTAFFIEPVALGNSVPSCRVQRSAAGVSITAHDGGSTLPRTVRWSYVIGSGGVADAPPTSRA